MITKLMSSLQYSSAHSQEHTDLEENIHVLLQQLRSTLQWQDILDLFEQRVELIDKHPAQGKQHGLPVLIVPGFSGNAEMVRAHITTLANHGRRTLCVNAPHGVETQQSSCDGLRLPQLQKAIALLGTLEKKHIHRVDAIGYSEAAVTMTIAAKLQPERFRHLVLMNPAGMTGDDSLMRLLLRFAIDKVMELWQEVFGHLHPQGQTQGTRTNAWKVMKGKVACVLCNPIQSVKEMLAISHAQIHEWLRELQEVHGIKVVIVPSADDYVFPHHKMHAFLRAAHIPNHRICYRLCGTHDTILAHPNHAMEVAEEIFDMLERESGNVHEERDAFRAPRR